MRKVRGFKESGVFIDEIQGWFRQRNLFISLLSIIILQVLFILLSGINAHIRTGIDSLLLPFLVLFVVSILSLAGVLCLYVGMFCVYDNLELLQVTTPHIANRLGYGVRLTASPLPEVADLYFLMGIFALILCTAVTFRPSLFRAKGNPVEQSYPLWTNDKDPKLRYGAAIVSLIPVQSLLSFAERHLVAKYKYIQTMIGGRIYFVSPEDWVPESSYVIREKAPGSLVGIPKVHDGFNIW